MQGDSWRKARIARIALIDMIFAFTLLCIHAFRLVTYKGSYSDFPDENLSIEQVRLISIFLWIVIFAVNILQLIVAFNLFSALKEQVPEPVVYISVSRSWLILSVFIVVILSIKLLLSLFGSFKNSGSFYYISIILCVCEITFKCIGIALVKLFVDGILMVFVPESLPSNTPIQFIDTPAP